jgi:pimeloyl-ACP methyl ester carboxylesterase
MRRKTACTLNDHKSPHRVTTLVLLPGLDGSRILFQPFVKALPDWVRAICVEYPADQWRYDALLPLAQDACRSADDYFILGWSFSGPLALRLAAQSPRGLRGVILCASFARAPWPVLPWGRFIVRSPMARLFPLFSRALTLSYETPELRRDKQASWAAVSPAALAGRSRAALGVDVRVELSRCRVPLMYLGGSRDVVVPSWNARLIKNEMPSAEVVTIDGPHLALRTDPSAAAAAVTTFMRAHKQ